MRSMPRPRRSPRRAAPPAARRSDFCGLRRKTAFAFTASRPSYPATADSPVSACMQRCGCCPIPTQPAAALSSLDLHWTLKLGRRGGNQLQRRCGAAFRGLHDWSWQCAVMRELAWTPVAAVAAVCFQLGECSDLRAPTCGVARAGSCVLGACLHQPGLLCCCVVVLPGGPCCSLGVVGMAPCAWLAAALGELPSCDWSPSGANACSQHSCACCDWFASAAVV